jgi:hypothetical protein
MSMMRSTGATLALCGLTTVSLLAASLLVATEAKAQGAAGPYMWGIGPKVGMMIIPGRYPYAFPTKIAKYDFNTSEGALAGDPDSDEPNRDLGANGEPLFTTLSPVGFDLRLGGEGFYGIDAQNRVGAGVGAGFGTRYSDFWFTLNYDRVLFTDNPFDVVAGVQIGYGGANWAGEDEDERLKMSYYPIRGRIAGQFRDKVRMYSLGLFIQTSVPARTTYTDLGGTLRDEVGGPGNFALFFTSGLEIDVQFGDFTAPRKKKKGGGKKGGANGSGGKKAAPKPAPKGGGGAKKPHP